MGKNSIRGCQNEIHISMHFSSSFAFFTLQFLVLQLKMKRLFYTHKTYTRILFVCIQYTTLRIMYYTYSQFEWIQYKQVNTNKLQPHTYSQLYAKAKNDSIPLKTKQKKKKMSMHIPHKVDIVCMLIYCECKYQEKKKR